MSSTFLLQFEETALREEPGPGISCGTWTGTKAREEPDQDVSFLGTQTVTMTREERDQDRTSPAYVAIPR